MNFNPRSHERSDQFLIEFGTSQSYFNPRSHERSDVLKQMIDIAGYISIHAPTRGATKHLKGAETVEKFQSTLPREERQNVEQYIQRLSDFNPRSHERSDSNGSYLFILQEISIHAPTRGATAILHKKFVYFYTIPTINI